MCSENAIQPLKDIQNLVETNKANPKNVNNLVKQTKIEADIHQDSEENKENTMKRVLPNLFLNISSDVFQLNNLNKDNKTIELPSPFGKRKLKNSFKRSKAPVEPNESLNTIFQTTNEDCYVNTNHVRTYKRNKRKPANNSNSSLPVSPKSQAFISPESLGCAVVDTTKMRTYKRCKRKIQTVNENHPPKHAPKETASISNDKETTFERKFPRNPSYVNAIQDSVKPDASGPTGITHHNICYFRLTKDADKVDACTTTDDLQCIEEECVYNDQRSPDKHWKRLNIIHLLGDYCENDLSSLCQMERDGNFPHHNDAVSPTRNYDGRSLSGAESFQYERNGQNFDCYSPHESCSSCESVNVCHRCRSPVTCYEQHDLADSLNDSFIPCYVRGCQKQVSDRYNFFFENKYELDKNNTPYITSEKYDRFAEDYKQNLMVVCKMCQMEQPMPHRLSIKLNCGLGVEISHGSSKPERLSLCKTHRQSLGIDSKYYNEGIRLTELPEDENEHDLNEGFIDSGLDSIYSGYEVDKNQRIVWKDAAEAIGRLKENNAKSEQAEIQKPSLGTVIKCSAQKHDDFVDVDSMYSGYISNENRHLDTTEYAANYHRTFVNGQRLYQDALKINLANSSVTSKKYNLQKDIVSSDGNLTRCDYNTNGNGLVCSDVVNGCEKFEEHHNSQAFGRSQKFGNLLTSDENSDFKKYNLKKWNVDADLAYNGCENDMPQVWQEQQDAFEMIGNNYGVAKNNLRKWNVPLDVDLTCDDNEENPYMWQEHAVATENEFECKTAVSNDAGEVSKWNLVDNVIKSSVQRYVNPNNNERFYKEPMLPVQECEDKIHPLKRATSYNFETSQADYSQICVVNSLVQEDADDASTLCSSQFWNISSSDDSDTSSEEWEHCDIVREAYHHMRKACSLQDMGKPSHQLRSNDSFRWSLEALPSCSFYEPSSQNSSQCRSQNLSQYKDYYEDVTGKRAVVEYAPPDGEVGNYRHESSCNDSLPQSTCSNMKCLCNCCLEVSSILWSYPYGNKEDSQNSAKKSTEQQFIRAHENFLQRENYFTNRGKDGHFHSTPDKTGPPLACESQQLVLANSVSESQSTEEELAKYFQNINISKEQRSEDIKPCFQNTSDNSNCRFNPRSMQCSCLDVHGNWVQTQEAKRLNQNMSASKRYKAKEIIANKAQLNLSIYVNSGLVTVHIIAGRKVFTKMHSVCNSFVKVSLFPEHSSVTPSQTAIVNQDRHPYFDEKFSFELVCLDPTKRLMITLWHHDYVKKQNIFLGCMSFGCKSIFNKKTIKGWYRVLTEVVGHRKHFAVKS